MTIDDAPPRRKLTLAGVSDALLRPLIEQVLDEAGQLGPVDVELTMLRAWLYETTQMEEKDEKIMLSLTKEIVKAVAVKYRLSPKRTDDLASAIAAVLKHMSEQADLHPEEV